MAGHSKWANIKHRKGANDAKKGKLYTKLNKEIVVSVKQGGPDPGSNPRLRLAISNAKGANMPKDNIERAIKKGSGGDGADYQTVSYEGYASNGVAVFVECMTDNLNRSVSSIRSIFSKFGGSLGKNGSIAFLFERQGLFIVPTDAVEDEDTFTLALIDAGAMDVEREDDSYYITCPLEEFGNLQQTLEGLGISPESAELRYIPNTTVALSEDAYTKVMKCIEALEDNDDVQKVYHNMILAE